MEPLRRRFALLIACSLFVVSCGGRPSLSVRAWTLERAGAAPITIELPRHLEDELPAEATDYVLRSHVDVPPALRGHDLTLAILQVPARVTLHVNGRRVPLGSASLVDGPRKIGPHRWHIPSDLTGEGALELALTVEHRAAYSSWLDSIPELSTEPTGSRQLSMIAAFNEGTAVVALVVALFLIVLAAVYAGGHRRRRLLFGWIAASALAVSIYPAFLLGLVQVAAGRHEATVLATAMSIAGAASLELVRVHFGLPRPSRAWWVAVASIAVAAALTSDSLRVASIARMAAGLLLVATVIAQIAVSRQVTRGARDLRLHAVLWPVWGALTLPDLAAMTGLGELAGGVHTGCVAIIVLAIVQVMTRSRDHLDTLRHADALNEELAARLEVVEAKNREVGRLDEELGRQVAARGEELTRSLLLGLETARPPSELSEGDEVNGRYVVLRALGHGGMSVVYAVERRSDARTLALKILSDSVHGRARARLAQEARIAASVNHPNVVRVVDVDVSSTGFLYLVMELVEGESLAEAHAMWGELHWALRVLGQAAAGLAAIHAGGIVHRDLKPGNVLLCADDDGAPVARISDFGISSLLDDEGSGPPHGLRADGTRIDLRAETVSGVLPDNAPRTPAAAAPGRGLGGAPRAAITETGVVIGTPSYMAPELVNGSKRAVPSSDVFSFGIIAYEVLTRERPFAVAPIHVLRTGARLRPAPPLRDLCPGLPTSLAALLERAVSMEPRERPTAKEIADALATQKTSA